ncbi:MAG: type VI secretion system contractile sheath large subunit [Holophagales bacterium]|nr:type VI secretion system contractile sheath large subunit [Holophagales bacterium]
MSKPFSFGAIDVRLEAESEPRPARAEDDAPFRILLAADFSGRAARGLVETGVALGERKVFRVDLDSLDATIARLEPQVRLRDGDVIRLRELDDFLPDTLFSRIARFATLKDASAADARRRTTSRPAAGLLDRILDGAPQEEAPVVEAAPDGPTDLMRTILGNGPFRTLEAAWRGVDFLLRRLDVDGPLTLHVVDISPEELTTDLLSGDDLGKTGLYRLLVEDGRDTRSNPVGRFRRPRLLRAIAFRTPRRWDGLAKVASKAGTAVLAGAEPGLLGSSSLAATPIRTTGPSPRARSGGLGRLRSLPEARYCGLALPRLLLRLPYSKGDERRGGVRLRGAFLSPSHEGVPLGKPGPRAPRSFSERHSSKTDGASGPAPRRRSPASPSPSSKRTARNTRYRAPRRFSPSVRQRP